MTAPTPDDDGQRLEFAELAAELNADPLSRALFERAQYKVLADKLAAQNALQRERIADLEAQIRKASEK